MITSEDGVKRYFESVHVESILEELLIVLAEKRPVEPYRCIAEWAATRSVVSSHRPSNADTAPVSGTVTEPQREGSSVSAAYQPRTLFGSSLRTPAYQWVIVLVGSSTARSVVWECLRADVGVDTTESEGELSEVPSSPTARAAVDDVRERLRLFFPTRQSVRVSAHRLQGVHSDSYAVFVDSSATTLAAERHLYPLSIADVVVFCGDGSGDINIGEDESAESAADIASRMGVSGAAVWLVGGGEEVNRVADATGARVKLTDAIGGQHDSHVNIFCVGNDRNTDGSVPLLSRRALLDAVARFPIEFRRAAIGRRSSERQGSSSSLNATREFECLVPLIGAGERIALGDTFFVYCGTHRFRATIQSIDLVFKERNTNFVLRRNAVDATGTEGAAMTLSVSPGSLFAELSAAGLPHMTLVRKDDVADVVQAVFLARLLSIGDSSSSSESDDSLEL